MLERMSCFEYQDWKFFAEINPFGLDRFDWHAAMIASVIHNVNRGKRGRRAKPIDYMPKFKRKGRKPLTGEQFKAKAMSALPPKVNFGERKGKRNNGRK